VHSAKDPRGTSPEAAVFKIPNAPESIYRFGHSGVCMANRNRLTPATFIAANRWRVTRRLAERDQRIAADKRTEAQKYLGDPPPWRSALAQRKQT
jgi:hypothetical protein